ncbi:calcium/sodium antiporter [Geofilum rubicundum]|uniref:calcium/sodium antiporter n=1 Tax=Geofilum rubicundum TaxID=472113 RepID=UPI0007853BF7|nr:calcium/sodium antiporter [Geofilum rubicundum]
MAIVWLIAGFILLFFSGDWLVKGSVALSRHFKISTLVIGLTVVAFGTSAPELFVSVKAAFNGVPDLAIGNVVGSNIANIGLILGLVAMIMPIPTRNRTVWFDWTIMIVATVLLMFFAYNGTIGFLEGIVFLVSLGLYLIWSVFKARRKSQSSEEVFLSADISIWKALFWVLVSVVGLYYGAEWLVRGATTLALSWGVSDRIIGISVVAFGTSVPELATSMMALYRKENDISVGNIIGSNIFNIWAVLGVTAVISPLQVNDKEMLSQDLLISIGFAVLLLLFMLPLSRGVLSRWKGAILFLLYILYIYILFA